MYMLATPGNTDGNSSEPFTKVDNVSKFVRALVYTAAKEYNITLSELMGSANNATLLKVTQKPYGTYMAQALSNKMRVDFAIETPDMDLADSMWIPKKPNVASKPMLNATSKPVSRLSRRRTPSPANLEPSSRRDSGTNFAVHAVLTETDAGARTRMVQNKSPKIALQAMLGFMAVGAILVRSFGELKRGSTTRALLHYWKSSSCREW